MDEVEQIALASDVRVLFLTAPDRVVGERLAQLLVESQLAACVKLLPGVLSVYRWQAEVETAEEVQLIVKTRACHLQAIHTLLAEQHPYDLPEFVALAASGVSRPYLDWLESVCPEVKA